MNILKSILVLLILLPINAFSQLMLVHSGGKDQGDVHTAYYDLRDRKSYIQITNSGDQNPYCIHVQIFQQDRGCTELDFYDELTANDTHIYDLDNLIRNDGSEVPINLDDDSYGYVGISAASVSSDGICNRDGSDDGGETLLGNFRIIDDDGYEYRVNLISEEGSLSFSIVDEGNIIKHALINYNILNQSATSDIVGYMYTQQEPQNDSITNRDFGLNFSIFQIDEDEERLSCDRVNFACGEGKNMYYGINEDIPASKGGPLLCNGAGLLDGQQHGYISMEDPAIGTNTLPVDDSTEFVCLVGLNNGNGTGSMDSCLYRCADDVGTFPNDCDDD